MSYPFNLISGKFAIKIIIHNMLHSMKVRFHEGIEAVSYVKKDGIAAVLVLSDLLFDAGIHINHFYIYIIQINPSILPDVLAHITFS